VLINPSDESVKIGMHVNSLYMIMPAVNRGSQQCCLAWKWTFKCIYWHL